jgi:hypothetical protein
MGKKEFEPYSSFEGRFVVLECQKKAHEGSYLYRGMVLRREGETDEIYHCALMDNDAIKKCYQPGDIVDAELICNNYSPNRDPNYFDFIVSKIRLVNKLSWLKIK